MLGLNCVLFSRGNKQISNRLLLLGIWFRSLDYFLFFSKTKPVYSRNIYCHSTILHYSLSFRFVFFISFILNHVFSLDLWKDVHSRYNDDDKVQTVWCKNLLALLKKTAGTIRERYRFTKIPVIDLSAFLPAFPL